MRNACSFNCCASEPHSGGIFIYATAKAVSPLQRPVRSPGLLPADDEVAFPFRPRMCPSTVNHLSVSVDVEINRLVPVKYLRTCEHVCSSLRRCGREAEAAVCRVAGPLSERRGGIQRPPNVLKGSAIVAYIVKSFTDQISSEIRHVRL
jgi:hypothetical protein